MAMVPLDLLAGSGMFSKTDIDEIVEIRHLDGLFVLARSIGLIRHTFDQKRLKQPLYRHPWEDVLYTKIWCIYNNKTRLTKFVTLCWSTGCQAPELGLLGCWRRGSSPV
ncbi:hypothetical protein MKW94_010741 [Papaver nudicaule]|uniref:Uncharacterized protein n=1 Tax=Papaver nudicaule TaxID=74823 RepID=A0AA41V3N4_PAPNU|nr:hypothetical protein [Papaver nudicaule]